LHSRASAAPPANTANAYKSLKLFGEAFEIVRADYVAKPNDAKLAASSIARIAILLQWRKGPMSPFQLTCRNGDGGVPEVSEAIVTKTGRA
jgi:hypothetical protein